MVLRDLFPMSKGLLGRRVHLLLVMLLPVRDGHTLSTNSSKHTLDACKLGLAESDMKYTDKQTDLMSHPFK